MGSDVRWSRRPGLVLQSPQIRLDLAAIDLQLRLVGEADLLNSRVASRAKDLDLHRRIAHALL